jgi:hypothetical protein
MNEWMNEWMTAVNQYNTATKQAQRPAYGMLDARPSASMFQRPPYGLTGQQRLSIRIKDVISFWLDCALQSGQYQLSLYRNVIACYHHNQ